MAVRYGWKPRTEDFLSEEIKMDDPLYIVSLEGADGSGWHVWALFRYHSDAEEYAAHLSRNGRSTRIEPNALWRTTLCYKDGREVPVSLDDGPTIRVNGRTAKKVKKSNAN